MIGRTNAQVVSGGGEIVTGQITGNDTTTLEITNINTQPRFIFIMTSTASDSAIKQNMFKFLWFDDADSINWIYGTSDVFGCYGLKQNSPRDGFGFANTATTRSIATQNIAYYDSANKKIVIQDVYNTADIFISTKAYFYLIGY